MLLICDRSCAKSIVVVRGDCKPKSTDTRNTLGLVFTQKVYVICDLHNASWYESLLIHCLWKFRILQIKSALVFIVRLAKASKIISSPKLN